MKVAKRIEDKIIAKFDPLYFDVKDESDLHKGHAGARPEGETHFRLLVVSKTFETMSRLERQRAIHACLADELAENVHALAIKTRTPSEYKAEHKKAKKGT